MHLYDVNELEKGYYVLSKEAVEAIVERIDGDIDLTYNRRDDEMDVDGYLYVGINELEELFGELSRDDLWSIRESLVDDEYGLVENLINEIVRYAEPPGITNIDVDYDVEIGKDAICLMIEVEGFYFDEEEYRNYHLDI